MYRYTTPTLPLTIPEVDFSEAQLFRVKIEQDTVEILKVINANDPAVDAEHKKINVALTQQETASFVDGNVDIQVRIKLTGDVVLATETKKLSVNEVLDEVII